MSITMKTKAVPTTPHRRWCVHEQFVPSYCYSSRDCALCWRLLLSWVSQFFRVRLLRVRTNTCTKCRARAHPHIGASFPVLPHLAHKKRAIATHWTRDHTRCDRTTHDRRNISSTLRIRCYSMLCSLDALAYHIDSSAYAFIVHAFDVC